MSSGGWVGIDLDKTLAHYDEWLGPEHIGAPIHKMVERVNKYLNAGYEVRVLTARANRDNNPTDLVLFHRAWKTWSEAVFGKHLTATAEKDYQMIVLYDDRAVQVIANTGEIVCA